MSLLFVGWAFGASALACPDYANNPSELRSLEPAATRGALSEAERECLEKNYSAATEQTVKNKISRVELVDAYAYDTKTWARLVQRHLDEVDRSDPDMAYLYAFWLYNNDTSNAAEAVRWCEVALERKQIWEGPVFVSRVYGLMKLRALAATKRWKVAEEDLAKGGSTTEEQIEELRTDVKVYAREWLDFAKVSGRDPAESRAACLAAANNVEACGEGEGSGSTGP
ncbi:MAG: hypothetical protein H6738_15735 [Alphaproteobacteria bacterium]|nr:hypothetical protein [Alphaproteobacteria bacterium]